MSKYTYIKHGLLLTCYHPYGNLILLIKKKREGDSSKLELWQYYCMVTPLRATQECCMLFQTNPGSNKTPSVQLLISHLTNHLSKRIKTCWTLLEKQGQNHRRPSPMDSYTWTQQYGPISKNLHSSALCRHWVQSRWLTRVMADKDR